MDIDKEISQAKERLEYFIEEQAQIEIYLIDFWVTYHILGITIVNSGLLSKWDKD